MRIALFWFSLATLLFTMDAMGSSPPVSGAPVLALAFASFTRAKLLLNPLRRHMFGSLASLQVVLPGLLYAAALAAFVLERMERSSTGVAFLIGAASAVGVVLFSGVLLSGPPGGGSMVRYVCARCGLGSDRAEGREPCVHVERAAPRGTSACDSCGQALFIEFNDHATGARVTGDGRGLEAR